MYRVTLFLSALFIISGCAYFKNYYRYGEQAAFHLKKGQHKEAVVKSLESLERNPQYLKPREILTSAYPGMVESFETQFAGLPDQTADQIAYRARQLESMVGINRRISALENSGMALDLEKVPFQERAQASRQRAQETTYQDALALLESGTREQAIAAAQNFKKLGDFKDARTKYFEARDKAFRKYVLIPVHDNSRFSGDVDWGSTFSQKLAMAIMLDPDFAEFNSFQASPPFPAAKGNPMTNPVAAGEFVSGFLPDAHFAVFGNITAIQLHPPKIEREVQEHSGNEKISENSVNGKKVTTTRTFKGKATHFTRTVDTEITLNWRIVELGSGRVAREESLSGVYTDTNHWATYLSGDLRGAQKARGFLESGEAPPEIPAPSERIAMGVDQLIRNSGAALGVTISQIPQISSQTPGSPAPAEDPSGLKVGVDKEKLLKKVLGQ